jgi:hypothetical protein
MSRLSAVDDEKGGESDAMIREVTTRLVAWLRTKVWSRPLRR